MVAVNEDERSNEIGWWCWWPEEWVVEGDHHNVAWAKNSETISLVIHKNHNCSDIFQTKTEANMSKVGGGRSRKEFASNEID